MTMPRAVALGLSDVAFFAPPPGRPRPSRRRTERGGAVGGLLRTIRRELERAASPSSTDPMPRITNYPY